MPNYRIDVHKNWNSRNMQGAWSNSYEIESNEGTPRDLLDAAEAIVAAERLIHLAPVQFLQVRVSTWEEDSGNGYDPTSFVTTPLAGTGAKSGAGLDAMDLNVCYVVKRVPALGRSGRLFYRGVLTEGDVTATNSGSFVLVPQGDLNDGGQVFTAFRTAFAEFLIDSEEDPAQVNVLSMISELNGEIVRRGVLDLVVGGVSINKRNHRYFDRVNN